jgi:hypothetical protein
MFRTQFQSATSFFDAFAAKGDDIGLFLSTGIDLPLGERVVIKALVAGQSEPVYLDGLVSWRRLRPRGRELPRGIYVALSGTARRRFNAAVDFLSKENRSTPGRAHPRFPVFSQAEYRTDRGEHPAEIRDISMGGAFLQVQGPLLKVGAHTHITLDLLPRKSDAIGLQAEVVRFDPTPGSPGLAVRFLPGQSALKRLARVMNSIQQEMQEHTVSYRPIPQPA